MIKVLIVDGNEKSLSLISAMLSFDGDVRVIGAVSNGLQAIKLTEQLNPDIVLIDMSVEGISGLETTEAIIREYPNTEVIMMSVGEEKVELKKAMQAGARDFVTKPFATEEIVRSIKTIYNNIQKRLSSGNDSDGKENYNHTPGDIITFVSGKGGVGKSIISANLAATLIEETKAKVCLIDLDLQYGNLNFYLDINTNKSLVDITTEDSVIDEDTVKEAIVKHEDSGVDLLLAPQKIEEVEFVKTGKFLEVLQVLRKIYDFIIIDTSSYVNDLFIEPIRISRLNVVMSSASLSAIKNTYDTLRLLEKLSIEHDKVIVVINETDDYNNIDSAKAEKILGHSVVLILPHDKKSVNSAANNGQLFVKTYPELEISRSLRELASIVAEKRGLKIATPIIKPESKKGFFGKKK